MKLPSWDTTQQSHYWAYTLTPKSKRHIARIQKQPKCPLTDKQIKNLWYIYTIEYYLTMKRNKFESVVVRWMNIKHVT